MTYRDLDHAANQLARYLQDLDLKANEIVTIFLHRSAEVYRSLLGIMKVNNGKITLK